MVQRIAIVVVVAAVLAVLLFASQFRTTPLKPSGVIECDEIRLGSRVGGRVKEVFVEEGDLVEAGQLLVELEPYDLLERQQQAAAQLAEAEAELARLTAGFRAEEIRQAQSRVAQLAAQLEKLNNGPRDQEIAVARSRVDVASAGAELADQNFARIQELYEQGVESQENFEQATEQLQSARAEMSLREQELSLLLEGTRQEDIDQAAAQLEEAQAAFELVQNGYRDEEVARARAAVNAATADAAVIERQLEELRVLAPSPGRVEAIDLQPGDLVGAGAPVLSMLDTTNLWVRAYVPENRLTMQVGDEAIVTVDSFPDREFVGIITFIAGEAEFTPSNVQTPEERSKQVFRIKVTLEEGHDVLHPGMPADVLLEERE